MQLWTWEKYSKTDISICFFPPDTVLETVLFSAEGDTLYME